MRASDAVALNSGPQSAALKTIDHGIPNKKRRYTEIQKNLNYNSEEEEDMGKENQESKLKRVSEEDEGEERNAKRAKTSGSSRNPPQANRSVSSAAKGAVHKAGRRTAPPSSTKIPQRSGTTAGGGNGRKGILSMSRLNALARPKERK